MQSPGGSPRSTSGWVARMVSGLLLVPSSLMYAFSLMLARVVLGGAGFRDMMKVLEY